MKILFIPILLLSVSVSWCQIGYQPIDGFLLWYLNSLTESSSAHVADVWDFDTTELPNDINKLVLTCVEVFDDSLDIYLLGISPENNTPFLMAISGYRGEYCCENVSVRYHEEEDEFELKFYIPGCARICGGYYRWNIDNQSLVQLRCYTEDTALEALTKADSLLVEGDITEAIDELSSIQHMFTRYYYDPDEMIARLLRIVNRTALEEADAGNYQEAVALFDYLSNYNRMSFQWYTSFIDSLDYMESDRSIYMSFSEYVMILNNYAFFLEQTDGLFLSQMILRIVLDLQPSRIVAHLNIADVLWKLAEFAEASEHYSIYQEMMTDRDLTDQIPLRVHERQTSLLTASADSVMVNILSEHLCPIETWYPIRIYSYQLLEFGEMMVSTNRSSPVDVADELINYETWTIIIEPDECSVSCEETYSDNAIILESHRFGDYQDMIWLIARTDQGDTLWTCALEGTGEYCYPPEVTRLSDGEYMLLINYDCWSSYSWTARISSAGEMIWHNDLSTNYMMELSSGAGEVEPRVSSFRETSSGDILACGSVSEWITSPDISFVCLLDGDTGNPLWKTVYLGLGQAVVLDAIETSSGMIVAVGSTGESVRPEDGSPRWVWGSRNPFIAILDPDGAIQKLVVCDFDKAYGFRSIIETDPINNEFLIAGGLEGELALLRVIIPTDQGKLE